MAMAQPLCFLAFLLLPMVVVRSGFSPMGSQAYAYRCPVYGGGYGFMSPYGGYGGGTYCGTGSLFHYWICCDYNPMECCIQLETWVIIGLVVLGLLGLLGCIGCCVVCFFTQRR